MEKSWIAIFVTWLIANIIYFIIYTNNDTILYLIIRSIMGLIILIVLYKTFKTPFAFFPKNIRKEKQYLIYKKIFKVYKICIFIGVGFFVLVILSLILKSYYLGLVGVIGFVLAFACLGLFSNYNENRGLFKVLFIILIVLLLIFLLGFVYQLNIIKLISALSIMGYLVILAFYGGIKMILSFPALMTYTQQRAYSKKK